MMDKEWNSRSCIGNLAGGGQDGRSEPRAQAMEEVRGRGATEEEEPRRKPYVGVEMEGGAGLE